MPGKKRTYKKQGGKRYHKKGRKKAKYSRPTTTIMKSPGFSDTVYVKLKYAQTVLFTPAVPYHRYTFRGNSLFDPDYSGGGHQPLYFDQYSLIYARYRVLGAKIKINAINASGVSACHLALMSSTDIFTGTDITALVEQPRGHVTKIIPVASRFPQTIKSYASTRKVCGLNKKQVFDEDWSALTSSSPSQLWYFNIFANTTDNSADVNLQVMVTLTYYCQFFDRLNMGQS